jgi:hypothetical protein
MATLTYNVHFLHVLLHQMSRIKGNLCRHKGGSSNKLESGNSCIMNQKCARAHESQRNSPCQLSGEPQEWLLKVVVAFGGDFKILQVLLAVKSDGSGFHFTLLVKTWF